jgi:hypothetical protein
MLHTVKIMLDAVVRTLRLHPFGWLVETTRWPCCQHAGTKVWDATDLHLYLSPLPQAENALLMLVGEVFFHQLLTLEQSAKVGPRERMQ